MEVDELDGVAVGIMEIKMPPGEAAVALVLVDQNLDAVGFEMRRGGIEVLALHQEGVMDEDFAALVRRHMRVVARLGQDEILLAGLHEDRGVVLPPEGGADDIFVEAARAFEIADADGEMQDAARLHLPRRHLPDAGLALQRRALEPAHSFSSSGTIAASLELRKVSDVFTLRTLGAAVSSATKAWKVL